MGNIIIKMALKEYKKMKKRSQVSFFVILGILLVIIVGFVIYLKGFTTKERVKKEVITTQQMPIEIQEINNYVVSCLEKVTQDGLEKIGETGGMIETTDGGTYNPILSGRDFAEDSGKKVNYAIRNVVVLPWVDLQGINVLPPLDSGAGNIIKNLKGYIKNFLLDNSGAGCLAQSELDKIKKGFSITPATSMDVGLDITNNDVQVHLEYLLKITDKKTGEERELKDFYVTEDVRLKKMHEFLQRLIMREINEKDFELAIGQTAFQVGGAASLGTGITGFDNYLKISDLRESDTVGDDIIEVMDEDSFLKGKPYSFRFARMNRKPVFELTYLISYKDNGNAETVDEIQIPPDTSPFTLKAKNNMEVEVGFEAYDKDEEDTLKLSTFAKVGVNDVAPIFLDYPDLTGRTETSGIMPDHETYYITLIVSDNHNKEESQSFTINVNKKPIAEIELPTEDQIISEEESVYFDGASTDSESDSFIDEYLWDFDGGASDSYDEEPGDIQFDTEGTYNVKFKVKDDVGDWSEPVTVTIEVLP